MTLLSLWVLFEVGGVSPAAAQTSAPPAHRVIVLLVPGLRADDLTRLPLPGLKTLRTEGAVGWMVCRAARAADRRQLAPDGRDTSASLALTLGSGIRALEPIPNGPQPLTPSPKVGRRGTYWDRLSAQPSITNHQSPATSHQLLIGNLVHAQGWRATVYGNDDTGTEPSDTRQQEGLLLAGDSEGRVDAAHTQPSSDAEATYAPYGRRDDVALLQQSVATLTERDALRVLVFGDLARADSYAAFCLPEQQDTSRLAALRSLDHLLTQLRAAMQRASGPPSRFLLLSPAPAASTESRDRLAPILMWGRDMPRGILTSPSTRIPGIVVNTDFLPTVVEAFGLPPLSGAIGRAFQVQPSDRDNTLAAWQAAHDHILQSERLKDVYGGLPTLQMLLVLAAFGLYRRGQRRFACACCAAIVALPFALLILPSLPFVPQSIPGAGLALAIFVLAFAAIAWRLYPSRHGVPLLLTVLFTVLLGAITLDLLSGSLLLRQAWMSYSVMEAARFYGIGNEYMGVVIGAACILLGGRKGEKEKRRKGEDAPENSKSLLQKGRNGELKGFSPFLLFSFSSFLLFLLAYNRFGAKVGAVPSAGIAFGVEGLLLWRGRLRWRDVLTVGGIVVLGLGGLLLLDMRHGLSEQSHFARTFAGSGGGLFAAASRKLLLEGYLLLHSPWSAALLVASLGFAYFAGNGEEKEKRRKGEKERQGTAKSLSTINPQQSISYALVAGALASLVCNDSGVTAAAMIMLFGFAWELTQAADRERLAPPERSPDLAAGE